MGTMKNKRVPIEVIRLYWERQYQAAWLMSVSDKSMVEETIERLKELEFLKTPGNIMEIGFCEKM